LTMFTAVVPVLNQHDTTYEVMDSWFRLAKSTVKILFIDNGSDEPLADQPFIQKWSEEHDVRVHRNEENVGVYPTFQQGFDLTIDPFIFFSHNDVEMLLPGWDEKITRILKTLQYGGFHPGVCGMFGAKRIGTDDIYKAPYKFTPLMRMNCYTVESMVDAGGHTIDGDYERIMVLDGFSLIVSRIMVRSAMGGHFDHERFPVHHMYDQDICVESHYGGFRNYAIDVDCKHHGGVTSCREDWAEKMGSTDLAIHRAAHEVFYEKWRGKLPVGVD